MRINGWFKGGAIGILGIALGVGGTLLTRHDASTSSTQHQDDQIAELMAFRAKIETNVEEWRREQGEDIALHADVARLKTDMDALKQSVATIQGMLQRQRAAAKVEPGTPISGGR